MADWIHCNKCFANSIQQEVQFVLTSCGHIVCERCFRSMTPNICYICNKECTTVYLSSNLPADMQPYFEDVRELSMRFANIIQFQKNNRLKYFEHMLKKHVVLKSKYAHSKEYIEKITKQNESLKKDNQRLKDFLKTQMQSPTFTFGPAPPPPKSSRSSSTRYNAPHTATSGNSSGFTLRLPSHNWNTPSSSQTNSNSNNFLSSFVPSFNFPSTSYAETPMRTSEGNSVFDESMLSNDEAASSLDLSNLSSFSNFSNISSFSMPSDRSTPKYPDF